MVILKKEVNLPIVAVQVYVDMTSSSSQAATVCFQDV